MTYAQNTGVSTDRSRAEIERTLQRMAAESGQGDLFAVSA